MRFSAGTIIGAFVVLAVTSVEGSFFRDVVGKATTQAVRRQRTEEALLAKATPLKEYRANLRSRGLEIDSEAGRELEQHGMDDYYMDDYYMNDFDGFSLKYAACQPVQRFSEDAIYAGEYTPMVTDDIVILRLCPSSSCNTKRAFGCTSDYVEYAISVIDYVRIMIRHKMDKKQNLCEWCDSCAYQRRLEDGGAQEEGENQNADGNQEEGENQNDQQDEQENQQNDQEDANQDQAEDQDQAEQEDDAQNDAVGDDAQNDAAGDDAQNNAQGDEAYNDDNAQDQQEVAGDDAYYQEEDVVDDDAAANYTQASYSDECYGYDSYCFSNGVSICDENEGDDSSSYYLDTEGYLDYLDCPNVQGYYLRPRCNAYDHSISMGIYYDKFCSQYAGDKVNMKSLGLGIQPNAFEAFYSASSCIDCSENNGAPYYDANSNMCNRLHSTSATCESNFQSNIFNSSSTEDDGSCTFIEMLRKGAYDEEGRLYGTRSVNRETTDAQKIGLVIALGLCGLLAVYSCYLHHSITNLLIRSISHTELLPPSRAGRRRSGRKSVSTVNADEDDDEDWHHVNKLARKKSTSSRVSRGSRSHR